SFRKREAAHKALRSAAEVCVLHLAAATKHPDAEIAVRAARLYERFRIKKIERLGDALCPKWPGINLGGFDVQAYWLDQARAQAPAGSDWPDWRLATRLYARHRLLHGASISEVRAEIACMAAVEREFVQRRRQ